MTKMEIVVILYVKIIYIFQPIFNIDENTPLFYRNNVKSNNKINTDTISESILK